MLFVYADASDGCGMVDRWKAANTSGFYLVLKVFAGYGACANQPNNWHQYGPASNYDVQGSHAISISPGYWRKGQTAFLVRDLARWNRDVANMVKAGPDLQLITTWNHWGDGTFVESSVELGRGYLDALHNNGQLPPTPTNTPPIGTDPSIMAAGDIICDFADHHFDRMPADGGITTAGRSASEGSAGAGRPVPYALCRLL